MANITRGTWHVVHDSFFVTDKKVSFDDDGSRHGETPNFVIECPNHDAANLVAAAPDLLDALKVTLAFARLKYGNLDEGANKAFEEAHAAIDKAEGQS